MLMRRQTDQVDWAGFEFDLWERFGVNAVMYRADGTRRTSGALLLANEICARIKRDPDAEKKICRTMKAYLMGQAKMGGAHAAGECTAGMYRILLPITREGGLEGYVSVCGRPFANKERIYTDYIHRVTGVGGHTLQELVSTLCPLDHRGIKEIKSFVASYSA